MVINGVECWKVIVPCRPGTINSPGIQDSLQRHDPTLPSFDLGHKWIVRLQTSAGQQGVGESGRSEPQAAVDACAAAVRGRDPRAFLEGGIVLPANEASYAFEVALLDLQGHIQGVPVHKLLGGKLRDLVPTDYWMGRCTVAETEHRATLARDVGFTGVKIKCAMGDPIVDRVRAIQRQIPGATVTIDANERLYDPESTMALAKALRGCGDLILESPVPQQRLDWYVHLRRGLGIPIALHFAGLPKLEEAVKLGAADCYNFSAGSPSEFIRGARICHEAGVAVWHGSRVDLGILDMAHIHAAAAAGGCTLPSDLVGNMLRADDLIAEPVRYRGGFASVPDAPGLGVELDTVALGHYRAP